MDLDGQYDRFRAVVGIDDEARPGGRVAFRVYDEGPTSSPSDDVLLFDSGEHWGGAAGDLAQRIDVGVAGVQTLKLVVDALGSTSYDWANWADAHLVPLGEVAYLSDLPFTATQVLDGGATPPVRRDTSADPTKPLKLDGTTYLKGLGAHAHSAITLDLDGQYDRFRAVLGVDDQVPGTGLVAFRVYDARPTGDVLLYDSGPRQKGDPALPLDLVVAGIATLKLVVDPQGVTDYDWADWADAHLIPKSDLGLSRAAPERTWTAYDGVNPYARFDGAGELTTRLLHGPAVDWLLARSDAEGVTDWYLTDRLGSVRALADAQGAVINRLDYDAYGNPTHESNPAAGDVFGFTARERDAVTGLQYNRHRYYDAAIGVWTQPDPIGFAGGDANLYRYVGNSPTNWIDPDGLQKRYWGQSLVEAGRWSWDVGSAGALGAIQGGANTINGVQDSVVGLANLPALGYNHTAGRLGGGRIGYIPSPDWSRDLIVHESETCHNISKFSGGTGLTVLVSSPSAVRSVVGRAAHWTGNARQFLAPTKDFAKYGGAQQRQALLNQVRATGTLSEAKGVTHSFREMKRLGYELQDVSLRYRGKQGLDLIFHNGSRYAVVEAKHGKDLSLLKTYKGCLRQGSLDYNISRLERYIQYGDGAHNNLANQLLNEAYMGQLESFGIFYRSGRVLELPIGWPNVPAIRR